MKPARDDMGQMLLATGLVMMLSLLAMAIIGVKMAGMGEGWNPNEGESVDVASEISSLLPNLMEERVNQYINEGWNEEEAAWMAANNTASDLSWQGSLNGVDTLYEVLEVEQQGNSIYINGTLSISDSASRLSMPMLLEIVIS